MTAATIDDFAIGAAFLAEARDRLAAAHALLQHCAAQLNDEQIWWRPRDSQNSIGNLLLHITGNLHERIVSLVGGESSRRNRPQEFAERGPIPRNELLERLRQVVVQCDGILVNLSPGRLLEPRSYEGINQRFDLNVLGVILHTLLHMTGHTQEIVFMTRSILGDNYRFSNPAAK